MKQVQLSIGSLSALTECNIPTIRYYEQIGLLPPAKRAANGHRCYGAEDRDRLAFIKRCRHFGFSIEQVRTLVEMMDDGDRACADVRELAETHLSAVRAKLAELKALEATLRWYIDECAAQCADAKTRDCTIVIDLSAKRAKDAASSCCDSQDISTVLSRVSMQSKQKNRAASRKTRRG